MRFYLEANWRRLTHTSRPSIRNRPFSPRSIPLRPIVIFRYLLSVSRSSSLWIIWRRCSWGLSSFSVGNSACGWRNAYSLFRPGSGVHCFSGYRAKNASVGVLVNQLLLYGYLDRPRYPGLCRLEIHVHLTFISTETHSKRVKIDTCKGLGIAIPRVRYSQDPWGTKGALSTYGDRCPIYM